MKVRKNKINIDKSLLQEQLKNAIEVYKKGVIDKRPEKVIIKYKKNVIDMEAKLTEAEMEFAKFDFHEAINVEVPIQEILEEEEKHGVDDTYVTIPYKDTTKKSLIGVYIVKSNMDEIDKLANKTCRSKNDIVNRVLNQIFDTETEKFIIDIEANKEQEKTKLTSFLINEKVKKTIKEDAKKKNMSDTEYFNKIIEESINKYFK